MTCFFIDTPKDIEELFRAPLSEFNKIQELGQASDENIPKRGVKVDIIEREHDDFNQLCQSPAWLSLALGNGWFVGCWRRLGEFGSFKLAQRGGERNAVMECVVFKLDACNAITLALTSGDVHV